MNRIIAMVLAVGLIVMGVLFINPVAANASIPGDSPQNPIVLASPSDVPDGAVKDNVSTYTDPNSECASTESWVLTVPGEHHDAVTHNEFKYQRTVQDYKTQYHFRKFTHTKHRTSAVAGFWQNFEPNNSNEPFVGPPSYPTDPRGKWSVPKHNGGPQQNASGVFQNGQGNGSWFYRQQDVPAGEWSDYSDWEVWPQLLHESWQDSPNPLGSPEFHAAWTENGVDYYREWQARFDGQTRQVENGSHVETTDWLTEAPEGDGWVQIDERTVTEQEAYDDPDVVSYYAWSDGAECPIVTPDVATATVVVTPPTCSEDGTASVFVENAVKVSSARTGRHHTVTFMANEGALFAAGPGVTEDLVFKTLEYDVPAATGDCPKPPSDNPPGDHNNPVPPKHNVPPATFKALPNAGIEDNSTNYLPYGVAGLLIASGALLLRRRRA